MNSLKNYAKPWTEADSDFIRENYPKWGKVKCAKMLGRTEASVKAQAKKLRVFTRVVEPWNDEDTRKLIELYPTTETNKLAEILGTSVERIKSKAGYLGITKAQSYVKKQKKKHNAWTDEEVAILKGMYADNYTADIPIKRTITAIRDKAAVLGLKKCERIMRQIRYQYKLLKSNRWG